MCLQSKLSRSIECCFVDMRILCVVRWEGSILSACVWRITPYIYMVEFHCQDMKMHVAVFLSSKSLTHANLVCVCIQGDLVLLKFPSWKCIYLASKYHSLSPPPPLSSAYCGMEFFTVSLCCIFKMYFEHHVYFFIEFLIIVVLHF